MLIKKGSPKVYLLFFIFVIVFMAPVSQGLEKTFPLDKVKPGMNGYGYTVFSGVKIEKFNVKVIATVDSSFGKTKLLLVKLSGKELEDNGGLSAGMSGSPVYLNNRLAGAISYGFENADSTLALVTPIDSMFNILTGVEKTAYLADYGLRAIPVATPVMISGMKRRGFELASHILESHGFKPVYVPEPGISSLEMGKGLVKPGSAIAVLMVAGDYQVSAIGTVTWIEGKDFLAFGHSYTNKGKVDYLAYQANIFQTVKSSQMPFKIGAPLKMIGRITQDRQAGILGRLEETPELIPVQVYIKDNDRNVAKNSTFYVVAGEQVFHNLIVSGVTDAIDQTIDRVGSGTARVTVSIEMADAKNKIYRENLFYSKDIAVSCVKELSDLLEIINLNDFSAVTIKNISVKAEMSNKQTSARIIKMDSESTRLKPGDTLKLNVQLHKYRDDNLLIPVEIKIPANMKPGKYTFTACGGSKEPADGRADATKDEPLKMDYQNTESLNDLLVNYLSKPMNNELVVDYGSPAEPKAEDSAKNQGTDESSKPIQVKTHTQYYLLGEAQLTIEVQ